MKICTKCEKKFPATTEFFHKKKNGRLGLQSWCKSCRKRYQQSDRCKEARKEILKKYRKSDKGKQAQAKFWSSEKGKEVQRRYCQTERGKKVTKQAQIKYNSSEKGKNRDRRAYRKNKLSCCISARIRHSLKEIKAGHHWETLVPYTLEELKQHLENLFQPGMSWENHTSDGWHIDHKIPISEFNILSYDCEDFKKCWALENLQPLWAKENWKKNNNIGNKEI